MIEMVSARTLAAVTAAALVVQPAVAVAQQRCITEDEVSAMAIYSVPSVVQSVRVRCDGRLSSSGFLARRGDAFAGRYAALQNAVWPKAKAGAIKAFAGKGTESSQGIDMMANLPDDAVRPLVDALIVQEVSARIEPANCGRIELAMEGLALLDPEVAGTMLGVVVGIIGPENPPVCRSNRI
jgi:hypothetical protein